MRNHNKKGIKDVFKLDSAENIGKKLLHGRDPSTYQGGSGGLGIIGGIAKGVAKMAGGFINTAKQYANLAKGGKVARPNAIPDRGLRLNPSKTPISPQKPGQIPKTSNFRPLITGNKVYGRKEINDAFKSRFGSPQAISANPKNVIKQATQGKDALTHLKKVKKMASNAGPKNSFKGLSSQSSTKRTNLDNLSRKYKNK